jgi:hypothetical protein
VPVYIREDRAPSDGEAKLQNGVTCGCVQGNHRLVGGRQPIRPVAVSADLPGPGTSSCPRRRTR